MPFQFSAQTFPSGIPYLRIDAHDHVELEHAQRLGVELERPEYRGKALSVVQKGTIYTPKARKHFQTINESFSFLAVVVTSAVLRTATNLMMRLTHDGRGEIRMFTDEAEALAWLERQ